VRNLISGSNTKDQEEPELSPTIDHHGGEAKRQAHKQAPDEDCAEPSFRLSDAGRFSGAPGSDMANAKIALRK
jgi:hypothetical protein